MHQQFKTHATTKLFYSKYPYKISTQITGGYLIRRLVRDQIRLIPDNYMTRMLSAQEKRNVGEYVTHIKTLLTDQIKIRFEGDSINFFIKDKQSFDLIINSPLLPYIDSVWEPNNDLELDAMITNRKIVIVDRYPHQKYTQKIFLKENIPENRKQSILNWLSKYSDDTMKISKNTILFLKNEKMWIQNPFILIKDPKMVTMLMLSLHDCIRRTEQFILRTEINT